MSEEDEMNGHETTAESDIASVIQQAADQHRQMLEQIAAKGARIAQIDQERARLEAERSEVLAELQQLHADLTSGRSASDALAALGVNGLTEGAGTGAKQPAKKTPPKKTPPKPPKEPKTPMAGAQRGPQLAGESAPEAPVPESLTPEPAVI
ncbi:hypothetical protein ONA92_26505 [Mycobacteroides salmoniphilum]|uniref:hypothetical protein n=1 Tax=Mycobacteroides salmoniphilum TaxID=404941 RepID=UPI0035677CCA